MKKLSFRLLPGSHLYKLRQSGLIRSYIMFFVPFRGLIFINGFFVEIDVDDIVFVPFWGLIFINKNRFYKELLNLSFRPLPGSHLYKSRSSFYAWMQREEFSSPSGVSSL